MIWRFVGHIPNNVAGNPGGKGQPHLCGQKMKWKVDFEVEGDLKRKMNLQNDF